MSVGNQADKMFLDALMYLGKAGQEYGIKNQMDQINQRAQEIESTMKDEVERRNALRALAVQSQTAIAGSGGSATQVAAIQNLIPPMPNSVAQAMLQGQLTGDGQMVKVAQDMLKRDEDSQIRLMQKKADLELMLRAKENAGKPDPELMMIRKENRQIYNELTAAQKQAIEKLAKLDEIDQYLDKGVLMDTGPLDQFAATFGSTEAQTLRRKMGEVSLQNMVSMFQGLSRSIDTEADRKKFEDTQLSMSLNQRTNKKYVAEQKQALQRLLRETRKKVESYKATGGLSFEALDSAPTEKIPGLKIQSPAGAAKSFYNE